MDILKSVRKLADRSKPSAADKCRKWFLEFFPRGFADKKYFAWERGYKLAAHEQWQEQLNEGEFQSLIKRRKYVEIASIAAKIEGRTNLLFSFEKMAFRDAVREKPGAKIFAEGLFELLYGPGDMPARFQNWCDAVEALPRKQTRVLTHPVVTIYPFIADPKVHIFLKPNTTKTAAREYGYELNYRSKPSWEVYSSLLGFAERIRRDVKDLQPRDMIDIQSFIWVIGSEEYRSM